MFKSFKAAIGSLFQMAHPAGSSSLLMRLPRTKHDYANEVGDGTTSSVIMAPIQFLQRNVPSCPVIVNSRKNGRVVGHPLETLLITPNPYYGSAALWAGTVFSWCIAGNAYWIKIRNQIGQPVALWWVPSWMITPKWPTQGSTDIFISHYEYRPGTGETIDLDPDDVVHFRCGVDPNNPRLGLSPLCSVMREVWSYGEASNWIASLLRNSGVPGVVVSPKTGALSVGPTDVNAVKKYIKDSFGGDRRGEPLVMSGPTDVREFGYDPSKMNLSGVRNTAEERSCAALGVPAAVVGFGTGLETTKVGITLKEFHRMAWENGIIPMQNSFAGEVGRSLLPDFEMHQESFEVAFDRSKVESLREDQSDLYARANIGVSGGWLTVAQAKRLAGIKADKDDEIYLRAPAMVEVPIGMTVADVQAENQMLMAPKRAVATARFRSSLSRRI